MSKDDEKYLKEFSKEFYRKIIDINDIYTFENPTIEWIKNLDKNAELILESMETYEQSNLCFSSIIGFFYQFGISCDVGTNKALELYSLSINTMNEKKFLN